jgi:thiol-disulfide isomerase/thioredoxin
MFIRLLLILFISQLTFNPAHAQGIQFRKLTLSQALQAARAEQKQVFVLLTAEWCGPCKWQSKHVFPLDSVGTYFNRHFVSISLNVDSTEGRRVANAYQTTGVPNMLALNADSTLEHAKVGAFEPRDILPWARKVVNRQDTYGSMHLPLLDTVRNPATLYPLLITQAKSYKVDRAAAEKYYALIGPENCLTVANVWINLMAPIDITHPVYRVVKQERIRRFGRGKVSQKRDTLGVDEILGYIIDRSLDTAINRGDYLLFEQSLRELRDRWRFIGQRYSYWFYDYAQRFLLKVPGNRKVLDLLLEITKDLANPSGPYEQALWLDCQVLAERPLSEWRPLLERLTRKANPEKVDYGMAVILAQAWVRVGEVTQANRWVEATKRRLVIEKRSSKRLPGIEAELKSLNGFRD